MLKLIDAWIDKIFIKSYIENLEGKERFLELMLDRHISVESALQTIRVELQKERGNLCNISA